MNFFKGVTTFVNVPLESGSKRSLVSLVCHSGAKKGGDGGEGEGGP